jgi:hypothetical protein
MPDDKDAAPAPIPDAREARVERLLAGIRAQPALREMAERLADLPEGQSFGQIEHDLRDLAHGVASSAHQAGLEAGKKRGT